MAKKNKHKDSSAAPAPQPAPPSAGGLAPRLRPWLPLLGLLVLVSFMRFNMVLWQPLIFPDSLQYMHLAKEIRSGAILEKTYDLDGGFIKSRRIPPFYSVLLAPFAETDADLETVGHLVSIVLSIYTLIPLYFLTAAIFSRREAWIAGLIFALHSLTNKFATPVLTESTFTALYLTVIWLGLVGLRRGSSLILFGAGAVSALTWMTRDVGISAFAVATAGAAAWLKLVEGRSWRGLAPAGAVLLGFLLVASPYFAHIRVRTGNWGLTLQMSTTGISDQVRLYGGDRFDRDRLSVREARTRMVGGQTGGVAGLIRSTPALAVKVVRNAWNYLSETTVKAQSLPLLLALLGLFAVGADFRRGRDRRRLFEQSWPAVWALQLLLLYALVTPYMVDVRYMYPLLPLVFALAGRGVTFAAAEVQSGRPGWPLIAAAVLAAAYVVAYPGWTDGEAYARLDMMLPQRLAPLRFLITPLSVSILFGVAVYGVLAGPLRAALRWGAGVRVGLGAALAAAGFLLMIGLAFGGMRLKGVAPAALLVGPGLGFILSGRSGSGPRPRQITGALVAGVLLFLAPDTIYQWHWFSSDQLSGKYSSGYKEAAAELKAAGIVPPGSLVCARKPFIAYYLDGRWYLDEEQQPIPKRDARLMELIRERKIDFLALDTFTMKNLRPALLERALDIEPIPGAALVYGRYFPAYKRIITIYDCRRDDPGPPRRATAADYFAAARQDYEQDRYPLALRELQAGLLLDQENSDAWMMVVRILSVYYDCGARPDAPSLALMPRILPAIVQATKNLYRLNPGNPEARQNYRRAEQIMAEEKSKMGRMRPASAGANNE